MNKILIYIATVSLILIHGITHSIAQTCSTLNEMTNLLGNWQDKNSEGVTTETWHKVSEKSFEGTGSNYNTVTNIKTIESLRLVEMSGEIFYIAKVDKNEFPVSFKLTKCSKQLLQFENSTHDFPKKLTYTFVNPTTSHVVVSGDEGISFEITYTKINDE